MRARRAEGDRGFALLWIVLLLLVVSVAGTVLVTASLRLRTDSEQSGARIAAFHAAQGGIERARWAVSRDAGYTGETLDVGGVEVRVHVNLSDAGRVRVEATAPIRGDLSVTRAFEARLVPDGGGGLLRAIDWRERR